MAGASIHFKGNPPFPSPTPHMFFVLGEVSTGQFVMVNATSKVGNRLTALNSLTASFGLTAENVSVRLKKGDYPFIKMDTIIDCSQPALLTREQLMNGQNFALLEPPADDALFVKLLKAWSSSPFVSPAHLNEVRGQWAHRGVIF